MEIKYRLEYLEEVVRKHIPLLSASVRVRIKAAIEERLATDPLRFGKPLQYSWKGHRRLRVGDWRIIYRVNNNKKVVTIVMIRHRRDIYKRVNI
tara:strand:- start:413 stop:694 length:282 start_codon:yes stop_codon:yes gene_type:complete